LKSKQDADTVDGEAGNNLLGMPSATSIFKPYITAGVGTNSDITGILNMLNAVHLQG
jgi:hypothetical protein